MTTKLKPTFGVRPTSWKNAVLEDIGFPPLAHWNLSCSRLSLSPGLAWASGMWPRWPSRSLEISPPGSRSSRGRRCAAGAPSERSPSAWNLRGNEARVLVSSRGVFVLQPPWTHLSGRSKTWGRTWCRQGGWGWPACRCGQSAASAGTEPTGKTLAGEDHIVSLHCSSLAYSRSMIFLYSTQ